MFLSRPTRNGIKLTVPILTPKKQKTTDTLKHYPKGVRPLITIYAHTMYRVRPDRTSMDRSLRVQFRSRTLVVFIILVC